MSRSRKVFLIILGLSLALGLLMGLVNLVAPSAVSVTWNNENVEGLGAIAVSLFGSGVPGVIFGLIGAGITALFFKGKKKAD